MSADIIEFPEKLEIKCQYCNCVKKTVPFPKVLDVFLSKIHERIPCTNCGCWWNTVSDVHIYGDDGTVSKLKKGETL